MKSVRRVGRILESDVWPSAKAMCVACSANKCRIQESDLRAFAKPNICRTRAGGCPVQSSALLVLHISEAINLEKNQIFDYSRFDDDYLLDN